MIKLYYCKSITFLIILHGIRSKIHLADKNNKTKYIFNSIHNFKRLISIYRYIFRECSVHLPAFISQMRFTTTNKFIVKSHKETRQPQRTSTMTKVGRQEHGDGNIISYLQVTQLRWDRKTT